MKNQKTATRLKKAGSKINYKRFKKQFINHMLSTHRNWWQQFENMRYNYGIPTQTSITINESYEAETIEEKVRRLLNNKEEFGDEVKPIYTERKDGVLPEYDIRTDKWDIALDAMTANSKTNTAKREARIEEAKQKAEAKIVDINAKNDKVEPIAGTEPKG